MKTRIILALMLAVTRCYSQQIVDGNNNPAVMAFAIYNGWSNSIVFTFEDTQGSWLNIELPQGQTFHGVTRWNQIFMFDYRTWLDFLVNQNGSPQFQNYEGNVPNNSITIVGDGSTNDCFFTVAWYPIDVGYQDANGDEMYNPGANRLQYQGVLYDLNWAKIPPVSVIPEFTTQDAFYYFMWGFVGMSSISLFAVVLWFIVRGLRGSIPTFD